MALAKGMNYSLQAPKARLMAKTTRVYDALARLWQVKTEQSTDVNSVVEYGYDNRGLQTLLKTSSGSTRQSYDAFGQITLTTDAMGYQTRTLVENHGRSIVVVAADGSRRVTEYDAFARVISETDALGNKTLYQFDASTRNVTTQYADGSKVTRKFNRTGQVIALVDALGAQTSYQYDKKGQLISTTDALGHKTSSNYDALGLVFEQTSALGTVTRYQYDALGRVLAKTEDANGLALTSRLEYDAMGDVVRTIAPDGVVTEQRYDRKGQTLEIIKDANGLRQTTRYEYDGQGHVISLSQGDSKNPQAAVTRFVYDELGRVRFTIDAENYVTEQKYNANGQVIESIRYTDKLPSGSETSEVAIRKAVYPSILSLDFDNGQTGINFDSNVAGSLTVAGGRLVAKNVAVPGVRTWPEINSKPVNYQSGTLLTAELSTTSLAGQSFIWGASNGKYGSELYRRHTFLFENGIVKATSINGSVVESIQVGSIKANTTYIMEVEAGESATTLYLYEKGQSRNQALVHQANAVGWDGFCVQGYSYCADGLIENIMYVDNVKLQSPQGQSNRFVYDALGRVRFSIDAENYVTEQKYNANGQVVESVRYTDKLPNNTALTDLAIRKALYPAAVSQDFSAGQIGVQLNGSIGNSLRVEGGRLVSQNRSLKNVQTWPEIASTAVDYKAGALLTADVTTTELAGMSFTLGSSNGEPYASVGFRRHTFAFEGGNVTAQSIRGNDVKSVFVGSVKANTTYVMEVEAGENETTLYLYEKGKTRAEGIIHTAAADNWNKFRLQGHSYCADGLIENIMYVDNVKLQSPQGQSNRFVYDALGRVRFSIDAENYVTEQKYNANGQVVESVRYTDKLPSNTALTDLAIRKALYPAAVSQDFSAGQIGVQFNGNIGNSLRVEGGRLVSQNRSLKECTDMARNSIHCS